MKRYLRNEGYRYAKKIRNYIIEHTQIDITSRCRDNTHVRARALYCILATERTDATLSDIGKLIGRTHASVIHATKLRDWVFEDETIHNLYELYDDYEQLDDMSRGRMKTRILEQEQTIKSFLKSHVTDRPDWFNDYESLTNDDKQTIDTRIKAMLKMQHYKHQII